MVDCVVDGVWELLFGVVFGGCVWFFYVIDFYVGGW